MGAASPEHLDVLIVGAGLSGIGAACHLKRECPGKRFAMIEAREASGGTWDLFRYPGIRSDSDMFTLGYSFRPWEDAKVIADGPDILSYIRDTARDHGVDRAIRFSQRVVRAQWSTDEALWTVEIEHAGSAQIQTLTCGFLFVCSGYYRYDEGFTPHFEGSERFAGEIVHPQHWPEDLDVAGQRVVVVGSGATAATLVPALAERAAHVTMLQRSPSYMLSLPARDPLSDVARRLLPREAAYSLLRWKNVLITMAFFALSRRAPRLVRAAIRSLVQHELPPGLDHDPHFRPRYNPWDQRVCLVPDGDLFRAFGSGRASVVTDEIETFTEKGLRLASGDELEADIIITATGLNLQAAGGIDMTVDGRDVELPETVGYKGMMLSGVPNMALTLGYTNASWTLKADLVAEYVCRLINHMDRIRVRQATPRVPDPSMPTEPFIDLAAGYVLRSIDQLPRQGDRTPWRLHQNYVRDVLMLRRGPVEDEGMEFSNPVTAARASAPLAA